MPIPVLTLVLVLAACAPAPSSGPSPEAAEDGEEAVVRTALSTAPSHPAGGAVRVLFRLTNDGPRAVRVLTWYTPLEGVLGDIFAVTAGDEELVYEGPMVKRAAPDAGAYVRLGPGESRSAEVDLAAVYPLREPGEYRVAFRGTIHDVVLGEGPVPSPPGAEHPVEAPSAPVTVRLVAR